MAARRRDAVGARGQCAVASKYGRELGCCPGRSGKRKSFFQMRLWGGESYLRGGRRGGSAFKGRKGRAAGWAEGGGAPGVPCPRRAVRGEERDRVKQGLIGVVKRRGRTGLSCGRGLRVARGEGRGLGGGSGGGEV